MAKWSEVIKSPEYQKLPPEQRANLKTQFFAQVVSKSEKFKKLPVDEQRKLQADFSLLKSEDNPKSTISDKVGQFITDRMDGKDLRMEVFKAGNQAVDALANKIEGTVKPGMTNAEMMGKFPQFLAAETLRGYKPDNLAAALIGGAALKAALPLMQKGGSAIYNRLPGVAQEAINKTGEVLNRNFTVGKGQPKAYQELAENAGLERLAGAREANEVASILSRKTNGEMLTQAEQRKVGRIFRGEAENIKDLPKYQEYRDIAKQGRDVMDKWSKELVKSGIPSDEAKEIIEENVGSYMARMYTSKLKSKTGSFFDKANLRLRLNGLKHRKDLTSEVRKNLGEIKEPALPTAIRVKEISESVANNRLFTAVSKNSEWVADTNLTGDMIKMPDTKSLGPLKGKYVVKEIGEDINQIQVAKTQAQGIYLRSLNAWKFGKVVLNPATHMRNMITNTMMLDLSGVNHLRQAQLLPEVVADYLQKGPNYQAALKTGAIGGEFVGGEVKRLADFYKAGQGGNLSRMMNTLKAPFEKAGNIYQAEEQMAKMIKFTDMLKRGATPEQAAKEAQKWLFDYNKIPKAVELAKNSIAPFITFSYKALPRVAEAMAERPLAVYKYYALFNGVNEASRKLQGMSPEEYARQTKALPSWLQKSIGGLPSNLLLPYKDINNRTQWLNLEYILPTGQLPEVASDPATGLVTNPLLTVWADLAKNKDFKGSDIIPVASTKSEAVQKTFEHIYRAVAPTFAPGIPGITKGGYSFEKIMDAAKKRPDFAGRVREMPPVVMDVLGGLKVTPLDVEEAEGFKMIEKQKVLLDLQKQAMNLNRPDVSEKEREKGMENIFKKMQKVMDE